MVVSVMSSVGVCHVDVGSVMSSVGVCHVDGGVCHVECSETSPFITLSPIVMSSRAPAKSILARHPAAILRTTPHLKTSIPDSWWRSALLFSPDATLSTQSLVKWRR